MQGVGTLNYTFEHWTNWWSHFNLFCDQSRHTRLSSQTPKVNRKVVLIYRESLLMLQARLNWTAVPVTCTGGKYICIALPMLANTGEQRKEYEFEDKLLMSIVKFSIIRKLPSCVCCAVPISSQAFRVCSPGLNLNS